MIIKMLPLQLRRRAVVIASTIVLGLFDTSVNAAGFQLFEESAVNMGNFGAGGAAAVQDVSTAVNNPASLTHLKNQQLVVSGDVVFLDAEFRGTATWQNAQDFPVLGTSVESGFAQGGTGSIIPALHYAAPYNDRWFFGINIHSPFGLETNYPVRSVVRYAATRTRLVTINASPVFAVKLDDQASFGAGFDAQYAHVIFNSVIGAPGFPPSPPIPFAADTVSTNKGYDYGYGWHAGFLFEPTATTRIGIGYRSTIHHRLRGKSELVGLLAKIPMGGILVSNSLRANLRLPETWIATIAHDFSDRFSTTASVYFTRWHVFENIVLENAAGAKAPIGVPQNFSDTMRIAGGITYALTPTLLLRAGAGYDQTPTNNRDRFVRLPDAPRVAVAVGAHYQPSPEVGIDVGVTHFFVRDAAIYNTSIQGGQHAELVGHVDNHADLVGLQINWNIA